MLFFIFVCDLIGFLTDVWDTRNAFKIKDIWREGTQEAKAETLSAARKESKEIKQPAKLSDKPDWACILQCCQKAHIVLRFVIEVLHLGRGEERKAKERQGRVF